MTNAPSPLQFVILAAAVAVANAGYLGAPAAVGYAAPAAVGYAAPVAAAVHAAPAYAAPAYGHALATPAITAQHSNILRTPGNLGQVSTYAKSIDTPYSSVRKSDVRVSNDALAYPAAYAAAPVVAKAPVALAAPAYAAHGYAAPAYAAHGYAAAPVVKTAATAVAGHGLLGVAYSAAPAVAHMSYSNGLGLTYAW
ncbi:hypothetical protein R5R35_008868 [Gryllus longicercus]|uniref:Uncharacterized protein n=1 Tax=Gryllus longicercus TaxID=2509291 RepID=A0AAN9V6H4_9ORTH